MGDSLSGAGPANPSPSAGPAGEGGLRSPRVEFARLALTAALALPGVVAGNAGERGIYMIQSGNAPLTGILAVAEPGYRYSIDLFLTAGLVPLHPLGEQVRDAVRSAAERAGMKDALGELTVTFLDLDPQTQEPDGDQAGAWRQ